MEIQGLIEKLDGLFFILLMSPANNCLKICMIRCLDLGIAYLNQELELLACVLELILLNFTVDHTIQRCLVRLIES